MHDEEDEAVKAIKDVISTARAIGRRFASVSVDTECIREVIDVTDPTRDDVARYRLGGERVTRVTIRHRGLREENS